MTRADLSARVCELLAKRLPPRTRDLEITERTRIVCLGMDSLSMLEVTVDVEDFLDVEIPDGDLVEIVTVGDLVGYLAGRIGLAEAA